MSKLIVLRVNSGSGKSTVAKELQRKFGRNTMLISQDVVRREMPLMIFRCLKSQMSAMQ